MLEKFFKRRKLEGTFLYDDVETLKAQIKEKDKIIIQLKEFIKKDLTEYNLINILINNYGWEEHTNAYNKVGYASETPYYKFGEIKLTLEKKKSFDMNNHLKEILDKEK